MSSCTNSELKYHVYNTLEHETMCDLQNESVRWSLVFCSEGKRECWAEFTAPIKEYDKVFHLLCLLCCNGDEQWHYSIDDPCAVYGAEGVLDIRR